MRPGGFGVGTIDKLRKRLKGFLMDRAKKVLTREVETYDTFEPNDMEKLSRTIRKGDVVLVEGRERISTVIKLFTQSQWSHSALFIGDELLRREPERREEILKKYGDNADKLIVEALVNEGVVVNPLEKYHDFNLRIVRPKGISDDDLRDVVKNALNDLGKHYDRRNILDLALQILPFNFGPFRKKIAQICIGACSKFQVMCSGFIAKAFQREGFSIRPTLEPVTDGQGSGKTPSRPVSRMPHPSWITPRDFDLSRNFEIIKI